MNVSDMKFCVLSLGVSLGILSVFAQGELLDAHIFLPLFERNTIDRKILDMRFSSTCKRKRPDGHVSFKNDVHLVFDAGTGMFRHESKYYPDPTDTNSYEFSVQVWDEKKYIEWKRDVDSRFGVRTFGSDVYESPGRATIRARPLGDTVVPLDIVFFFDGFPCTFAKTVPDQKPKLRNMAGSTITLATKNNTFTFSKKTGALEKIEYCANGETYLEFKLENHIERAGVWIPLRIVSIIGEEKLGNITELVVDPQTLRLLNEVEDDTIFSVSLPVGCYVDDDIRKKVYFVTTLDTNPPQDVDALQKMLDKMLEQAEEQKAAVEKAEQEKK